MAQATLVGQLIHQAKTTFAQSRGDARFLEEMEKLRKIMKSLTAKDFNITPEVTQKSWDFPPFIHDSPAAFMEVHESDLFSVGIFMLKPWRTMPFHDHPGMFGLMKVLFGSMSVNSYNYPTEQARTPPPYLIHHANLMIATPSSELCSLSPDRGNIHEIRTKDEAVVFVDILAPPYNPNEGRDCTYYFKEPPPESKKDQTCTEKSIWVRPGKNPPWFSCVPQPYPGPRV